MEPAYMRQANGDLFVHLYILRGNFRHSISQKYGSQDTDNISYETFENGAAILFYAKGIVPIMI